MYLLEDISSPESSNHLPSSRFESYINVVSIFCGAIK